MNNRTSKLSDRISILVVMTGLFALMLCIFAISPLAYMWIVGTVGSLVVLGGGMVACGSLCSNGSFWDAYIAMKIMEATFQVIGAIFCAMAEASK